MLMLLSQWQQFAAIRLKYRLEATYHRIILFFVQSWQDKYQVSQLSSQVCRISRNLQLIYIECVKIWLQVFSQKSMNNQEIKCLSLGCQSKKNLFFCCNIDSPRCLKCSEPCKICGKERNTTMKSVTKSTISGSNKQCRLCKVKISKQWLNFQCNHSFCTKCVSKTLCSLIKHNIQKKVINHDYQSISCSCSKSSSSKIWQFLEKYCFCCGQTLEEKQIVLIFSLRINDTCQKRIQFSSDEFNKGKTFLDSAIYKELLPKCQRCNVKIEELRGKSNNSQKETLLCSECSKTQEKHGRIPKQEAKQNKQSYNIDDHLKQQRFKVKEQKIQEKMICYSCERKCYASDLIQISQFIICKECFAAQNREIDSKIKPHEPRKVGYQQLNLKRQKHEAVEYNPTHKLCDVCDEYRLPKHVFFVEEMNRNECIMCTKNNHYQLNMQNSQKKLDKANQKAILINRPEKKKLFAPPSLDIAKINSISQAVYCMVCSSRILSYQKSTESEELGGSICFSCFQKNKLYYSNKQKSKLNQSQVQKSNKVWQPEKLERIQSESKAYQQKIGKISQKNDFQPFAKNLVAVIETRNTFLKEQSYIPSIIQPQVEQKALFPIITKQKLISCYFCGYLSQEKSLLSIYLQGSKVLVCVSCQVNRKIKH